MKRIGIVGGGFAGFEAAVQLDDALKGRRSIELVLVNENPHFTYTPLLVDVATGSVSMKSVMIRTESVLSHPRSRFVRDRVVGFDLESRTIVGKRESIACDYLVVAVGSHYDFMGLPGVEERALTLGTARSARQIKGRLLSAFRRAKSGQLSRDELAEALTFVIAGAGQTGVELAAELVSGVHQSILPLLGPEIADVFRVVLVEPSNELLPRHSPALRQRAEQVMARLGVDVRLGDQVVGATANTVQLETGNTISSENLVWAATRKAPSWLKDAGVPLTEDGYIPVGDDPTVEGHRSVFAAGSCARLIHSPTPIPNDPQVSSRQGTLVANNIIHDMVGASHENFHDLPFNEMITLGRLDAAARFGPLSISGALAQGLYRAAHVAQTPTLTKKLAMLTDWTEKFIRGRDLGRLLSQMPDVSESDA